MCAVAARPLAVPPLALPPRPPLARAGAAASDPGARAGAATRCPGCAPAAGGLREPARRTRGEPVPAGAERGMGAARRDGSRRPAVPPPRPPRRRPRWRVAGDRVDQLRPQRAGQVVPHALDHHQPRARDRARRRAPARGRDEPVGGAVDDERRRGDAAQFGRAVARGDDRGELAAGPVGVVVAVVARADQLAHLLEVARRPGEPISSNTRGHVLDEGLALAAAPCAGRSSRRAARAGR